VVAGFEDKFIGGLFGIWIILAWRISLALFWRGMIFRNSMWPSIFAVCNQPIKVSCRLQALPGVLNRQYCTGLILISESSIMLLPFFNMRQSERDNCIREIWSGESLFYLLDLANCGSHSAQSGES